MTTEKAILAGGEIGQENPKPGVTRFRNDASQMIPAGALIGQARPSR